MPLNFSSQARACLEWIGHPRGSAGSTSDGIYAVLFLGEMLRSAQSLESKQCVGESKRRNTMSILIEGAADKSTIVCHKYSTGLKRMRENPVVPLGLESFLLLSPALKRWANVDRPSGTRFSSTAMQTLEALSATCWER